MLWLNCAFVAWEENIISKDKGNRIVHYYLKDGMGGSLQAVVDIDRSVRHMAYEISGEFLDYYGCRNTVIAGTKWSARREVVEWLISLVRSHHQPSPISNSQIAEPMAGITNPGNLLADKELVPRKLKSKDTGMVWVGEAKCSKRGLKRYPAIFSNGTIINVHSFAFVMAEEESRYLGYLVDLYEDKKDQKCIKIRWFHSLQEVKCVIPELDALPREVFISTHHQVISAGCIDGRAIVLTPEDHKLYAKAVPESSLSEALICSRELKNNKTLPFDLTKLRGYYDQYFTLCGPNVSQQTLEGQETHGKASATKGSGILNTLPGSQVTEGEPTQKKLKIKLSRKGPAGSQRMGPECKSHASFKVGDNIELLCQDSGIRGCWFKCMVIQAKQRRLKVKYFDVNDVEGPGKLEEWIHASRAAVPDKLNMRHNGRLTVRPWPIKEPLNSSFEVGDAVDAWWTDGWWEGVVAGFDVSKNNFLVYLPGENRSKTFPRRNLRVSRDWIGNKWVNIKPKPDIWSAISAVVSGSKSELSKGSTSAEAFKAPTSSLSGDGKVLNASKPGENVEKLDLKKQLKVNDQKDAV